MLTELQLMQAHVEVLFQHDVHGFLTHINEPPHEAAPRFFLGLTKVGYVHRYRQGLGDEVVRELEAAMGADPGGKVAAIINALGRDRTVSHIDIGPAYRFPDVTQLMSDVVRISMANRELLQPHFPYTFAELAEKLPCYAVVQDGAAVAVGCSARQTPAAAEVSFNTLEPFRGRGYGACVAQAWAAEVQGQGRIALYSTAWDNFASQAVARKLQLVQYGTDLTID